MTGLMYKVEVSAVGEVRDSDGNLLSAEPVTAEFEISEEQLRELQKSGMVA